MQPVTAVILTYNEAPNISRVLQTLDWCDRIVILDSGSTDETKAQALGLPNVHWFTRTFDSHAQQWRFAIERTGITTELVLALDSDMLVPPDFADELRANFTNLHAGGILTFRYCSLGKPLSGSLYPPQLRLLRRSNVKVVQRGHTQEFQTEGPLYTFKTPCIHDDRKPVDHWFNAQIKYSDLEWKRISEANSTTAKDLFRKLGIMPLVAGALAYVRAGGPFSGKAALNYSYERMAFETMLALRLLRNGPGRKQSDS